MGSAFLQNVSYRFHHDRIHDAVSYNGLHMNGVQMSGSLRVITRLRRTPRNCKPLESAPFTAH
jgi:hypothetical protein